MTGLRSEAGQSAMKAIDLQIDVLHFIKSPWGAQYCNALLDYAKENPARTSPTIHGEEVEVEIQVTGPGLVSATNRHVGYQPQVSGNYLFQRVLTLAETYAVSSEIAEVINYGASPTTPCDQSDLPSESGFVVFDAESSLSRTSPAWRSARQTDALSARPRDDPGEHVRTKERIEKMSTVQKESGSDDVGETPWTHVGTRNPDQLVTAIVWMAQTTHQAYHGPLNDKTWRDCKKSICRYAAEIVDG